MRGKLIEHIQAPSVTADWEILSESNCSAFVTFA